MGPKALQNLIKTMFVDSKKASTSWFYQELIIGWVPLFENAYVLRGFITCVKDLLYLNSCFSLILSFAKIMYQPSRAYGKGLSGRPGKALVIGHNTPSDTKWDNKRKKKEGEEKRKKAKKEKKGEESERGNERERERERAH